MQRTATQELNNNCLFAATDTKFITISDGVHIITPSIEEKENLQLYPNPTHGSLTIILPEIIGITDLSVLDINGRTVYQLDLTNRSNGRINIDLGFLKPGSYVVRAKDKSRVLRAKCILE
jgi:hypothetical protein